MTPEEKQLFDLAKDHLKDAYAPYSNFHVAAALVTDQGEIFTGVNIENSSFGLTNCAERTAMFGWVNSGRPGKIKTLLIIGNTDRPISPCGACRQVMSELMARDAKVILADSRGDFAEYMVEQLLPYQFTEKDIKDGANK